MKKYIFIVSLLILSSACASDIGTGGWFAKDADEMTTKNDFLYCKKKSSNSVMEKMPQSSDFDRFSGNISSPFREYERMESQREYNKKIGECMMERGYSKNVR